MGDMNLLSAGTNQNQGGKSLKTLKLLQTLCSHCVNLTTSLADNCLFSINLSIILIFSGKPWIGKDPTLELSSPALSAQFQLRFSLTELRLVLFQHNPAIHLTTTDPTPTHPRGPVCMYVRLSIHLSIPPSIVCPSVFPPVILC